MTAAEHIGARIRQYRKMNGLSLDGLAQRLYRSKSTISKYESGTISVDVNTLTEIARALNVTLGQLTDYYDPRPSPGRSPKKASSFFRRSDLVYMYMWYRYTKTITCALQITQRSEAADSGILYFGIAGPRHYTQAEYLCASTIEYIGEWTYLTMKNQPYNSDYCFMIAKEPYNASDTTVGILAGVSQSQRNPMASKMLFSLNPLELDDPTVDKLKFSADNIRELRRDNMLLIR